MSTPHQHTTHRGLTANPALTPKPRSRPRRYVENTDYAAFVSRAITAHGRRIAEGKDIDALPELVALTTSIDTAIATAITGLRTLGYSWADIALRLGITRQAAHQRWGTLTAAENDREPVAS